MLAILFSLNAGDMLADNLFLSAGEMLANFFFLNAGEMLANFFLNAGEILANFFLLNAGELLANFSSSMQGECSPIFCSIKFLGLNSHFYKIISIISYSLPRAVQRNRFKITGFTSVLSHIACHSLFLVV